MRYIENAMGRTQFITVLGAVLAGLAGAGCAGSNAEGSGARADRNATRGEVAPRESSAGSADYSTPRDMPGAGRGSRESLKGK